MVELMMNFNVIVSIETIEGIDFYKAQYKELIALSRFKNRALSILFGKMSDAYLNLSKSDDQ